MLKNVRLAALLSGLAFSSLVFSACERALPTNDPNFCASFKRVSVCYCQASGLPAQICQNMNQLAESVKAIGLEKACRTQKYTTPQDCMDNWICYLNGGVDSRNRICSGNYKACPK